MELGNTVQWRRAGLLHMSAGALALLYSFATCDSRPPPGGLATAHPGSSDKVRLSPSEIDLGKQPWWTKVPFEFDLVNGSDQLVRIVSIVADCGCTVLSNTKDLVGATVPPGTDSKIAGELNTETTTGGKPKRVTVSFQLGDSPTALRREATLRVEAVKGYSISPVGANFGTIDPLDGKPPEHVVTFSSTLRRVLEPPQCSGTGFKVRVASTTEHETTYVVAPDPTQLA